MSYVRTIVVGGRRLRVAVRPGTDPARPPLLLCNGIGASLELLQPLVDLLDPAIEVVRFDPPGVGGSTVPLLPYPFPALARLVGRMLASLGYDRFDALGISWGGGLAQQLALQNPRRCRRLVLVATATGCLMVPARPRVLLKMATPRRYRDSAYARSIAGELYGGDVRRWPELVRPLILDHDRPASDRGYLYQLASGFGWTSLPFLPLIRQQTLILAGDDDPIIPLINARVMARLLPSATLHVYPDGHLGLITMAEELAPVISRFVDTGQLDDLDETATTTSSRRSVLPPPGPAGSTPRQAPHEHRSLWRRASRWRWAGSNLRSSGSARAGSLAGAPLGDEGPCGPSARRR